MKASAFRSLLGVLTVGACSVVNAQGLKLLETENQRLLYIDPATTYLAPYAARTFENSLIGQRKIFGYEPSEKVTVLLLDFTDYGNAGASPVPRNTVIVDVAPKSDR